MELSFKLSPYQPSPLLKSLYLYISTYDLVLKTRRSYALRGLLEEPNGIPRKSLIFQPEKIRDETSLLAAGTACSPCWLLFYVLMFYLDLPFALTYFLVFVIRGFIRHFAQTMRWAFWTKYLIKLRISKSKKEDRQTDNCCWFFP